MNIEKLDPAEVDHPGIREALIARRKAEAAAVKARQDLVELEQTREQAEWKDAEAAEQARAHGKSEPKRTAVAEHDRKTEQARHELKVAELAARRAARGLSEAVAGHADEWKADLREEADRLEAEWTTAVEALTTLYARRSHVLGTLGKVMGEPVARVGAIRLKPAQLHDIEIYHLPDAESRRRQRAVIVMGDVLAALSDLGKPDELDPPPAFTVADQMAQTLKHTQAIRRGYGDDVDELAVQSVYIIGDEERWIVQPSDPNYPKLRALAESLQDLVAEPQAPGQRRGLHIPADHPALRALVEEAV